MPTIRHIDIKGIEYFFSKSEGIRRDTKNSTRKTANVQVELTTHALLDPEAEPTRTTVSKNVIEWSDAH
ncbi:hypothetical protein CE91St30_31210 [Raoultibacter timonensis]|uniref:Uncharacterized protein n=1 Tax=Raoultibacter timonensis TaxID=1907662 RepID=A0ABM7WMY1_9ACTN|nr:hypothetical protein CE91St30_31210 [Raoultibacter timonensis]BDF52391.1 hypothetical protein CE91St31_31210 [Raoultibacter timonensis]